MNELADIHRALGRIEGKQDAVLAELARGSKRMDNHDRRLGSLERWRTWTAGIGATLAGLIGIGHLPKL